MRRQALSVGLLTIQLQRQVLDPGRSASCCGTENSSSDMVVGQWSWGMQKAITRSNNWRQSTRSVHCRHINRCSSSSPDDTLGREKLKLALMCPCNKAGWSQTPDFSFPTARSPALSLIFFRFPTQKFVLIFFFQQMQIFWSRSIQKRTNSLNLLSSNNDSSHCGEILTNQMAN